jgi:hypothetical protein
MVRGGRSSAWAALTAGGLALVLACGDSLQQEELDCEEAVSHLEHCCPGFASGAIACVLQSEGCNTIVPDLSIADSQCIRGESCGQLVTNGVCARAQQAGSNRDGGAVLPAGQRVCR